MVRTDQGNETILAKKNQPHQSYHGHSAFMESVDHVYLKVRHVISDLEPQVRGKMCFHEASANGQNGLTPVDLLTAGLHPDLPLLGSTPG